MTASTDLVRLAVCADDFGLDPCVDAGAVVLAGMQRLSAIACMVGAPYWRTDAGLLRGLDPRRTETGLHLDLTQHPFDARLRRPLPEWILRSYAGALDRAALRREVGAQIDAFVAELQRPPAFVDGHEYVHQLPGVRDVLLQALAERGLRPWLRSTRRPPPLHSAKARLIEALGASGLARRARAQGLLQNRRLLGIYPFDDETRDFRQALAQWLAVAQSGDLLVCHPAAGLSTSVEHAAARRREFASLSDPAFDALLERSRVGIVPLGVALASCAA